MLIHTVGLTHAYGARVLFRDLNLQVPPKARIGLVGPNGAGKTTLLRLLLGLEEPTAGRVHRARGLRVGYLPQGAVDMPAALTLAAWLDQPFAEVHALEARLRALEAQMAARPDDQALLARYGRAQAAFERLGGYTYAARQAKVLHGLGFSPADRDRPLTQLSGGQRTRAYLARLLLEAPDLLVLDEPTNHLDLAGVEFLERWLQGFAGAVLFVSHDRYFLDQIARTIWELTPHGLEVYRGNYSAYLQQRAHRWRERRARWDALLQDLHKDLDYIRRHIAGQNSQGAKGRLKRLSRAVLALEAGGLTALEALHREPWGRVAERFGVAARELTVAEAARRLRGLRFPDPEPPALHLRLESPHQGSDWALRARNLVVGYPDRPLVRVPRLDLRRGQCAALLGPNGSGKTTFLRTVLGELAPLAGDLRVGPGMRVGYFAQAAADLNPQRTVLEELLAAAPHLLPAEARHHLARYLLRGDAVERPVAALSGGERARLALAKLALQGANFLLLDEPTNHLDIPAQEALQAVLARYPGTILLVSHDRYLVRALATQIWVLRDGQLEVFAGPYDAFVARAAPPDAPAAPRAKRSRRSPRPAPRAGLSKNERRKLERRLAALEDAIAALEDERAEMEARLSAPPPDPAEVRRLSEAYAALQARLDAHLAEWERVATALEDARPPAEDDRG